MKIKYTGRKAKWFCDKAPGIVWAGPGDVQEVSEPVWAKLKVHADVLQPVDDAAEAAAVAKAAAEKAEAERLAAEAAEAAKAKLTAEQLDDMSDEDVHAAAKARNFGLHHKLAGDNLRAKFLEAQG